MKALGEVADPGRFEAVVVGEKNSRQGLGVDSWSFLHHHRFSCVRFSHHRSES
jgi:hypothetical protein